MLTLTTMEEKNKHHRPIVPLWFGIVAAASFIPVIVWPWMIASSGAFDDPDNMSNLLLITFPVYAVLSIYLSYRSIAERPYIAVILLAILWLSFGALWLL